MARTMRFEWDVDHWIDGAARFERQWQSLAEGKAEPVAERGFRVADAQVHVISGQLKASGRYFVEKDGNEVQIVLAYEAPYAIYEFGRGGEHDALTPAIITMEDEILRLMMESIEEAIDTWR